MNYAIQRAPLRPSRFLSLLPALALLLGAAAPARAETVRDAKYVATPVCYDKPYCRSAEIVQAKANQINLVRPLCKDQSPHTERTALIHDYYPKLVFARNDLGANGKKKPGGFEPVNNGEPGYWIYDGGPATAMNFRLHVFCEKSMGPFGREVVDILWRAGAFKNPTMISDATRLALMQAFGRARLGGDAQRRFASLLGQPVGLLKEVILLEGVATTQ